MPGQSLLGFQHTDAWMDTWRGGLQSESKINEWINNTDEDKMMADKKWFVVGFQLIEFLHLEPYNAS